MNYNNNNVIIKIIIIYYDNIRYISYNYFNTIPEQLFSLSKLRDL